LPTQQLALVEAVGKSSLSLPEDFIRAMGLDAEVFQRQPEETAIPAIPFTPLTEIERAVERRLSAWDLGRLTRQAVQDHIDRLRGRI
jgi:hypothetical protein